VSTRIAAVVLRQFYLLRDSPGRVLPLFAWVLVDVILWGFITKYLNAVAASGFNFVPGMLGTVLLWDFCGRVIHGVTTAFLEDVWARNFLNVFASPLTVPEYLAGLVITSLATSLVGLLAMLALASFGFGLSFFSYGLMLIPFLLVLFAFGTALGIVACAVVLRLGPASEWLVWPIPAMLAPFAGVFYPLSVLPRWMQLPARLVPPSYVFEGIRQIAAGGHLSMTKLAAGGALSVLYILLACGLFLVVHRQSLRSGLLARYSAESVS
jgi:ABC-2 type transport system permease protein